MARSMCLGLSACCGTLLLGVACAEYFRDIAVPVAAAVNFSISMTTSCQDLSLAQLSASRLVRRRTFATGDAANATMAPGGTAGVTPAAKHASHAKHVKHAKHARKPTAAQHLAKHVAAAAAEHVAEHAAKHAAEHAAKHAAEHAAKHAAKPAAPHRWHLPKRNALPDLGVVNDTINDTLDTVEDIIGHINGTVGDVLEMITNATGDLYDALLAVNESAGEALTELAKQAPTEEQEEQANATVLRLLGWASELVLAVNGTLQSATDKIPKVQAKVDATLAQVMPPLEAGAEDAAAAFAAVTVLVDQASSAASTGASAVGSAAGALKGGKAEAAPLGARRARGKRRHRGGQVLSLLAERAFGVSLMPSHLDRSTSSKGGGDSDGKRAAAGGDGDAAGSGDGSAASSSAACDKINGKIDMAKSTMASLSEQVGQVNETASDVLGPVLEMAEATFEDLMTALQDKVLQARGTDDPHTEEALNTVQDALEAVSDHFDQIFMGADEVVAEIEESISKGQKELTKASSTVLGHLNTTATAACSLQDAAKDAKDALAGAGFPLK